MDLFSPLRFGVQVTTEVVKLATAVPRAILQNVVGGNGSSDDDRFRPTAHPIGTPLRDGAPSPAPEPSGPARGGTGRRPRSAGATRGRATSPDGSIEVTASPPDPTSAAGASGGVAGTADAPQDAARAEAPDPTAASTAAPRPVAPQRERTQNQVRATPAPREKTVDDTPELAETEGSASPGAEIRVDVPWEGYDKMKANDIVDRLKASDPSARAVVRLYEQQHKKRKSILSATE
jgi:hypothetical protein